ncbi:hypothetical protein NIES2104_21310 [Leptolyngbya sp. NIES-2104]|nr:hypothetical protein NIES2104_21310 [Leptolyngbya sp. NIES-2104]
MRTLTADGQICHWLAQVRELVLDSDSKISIEPTGICDSIDILNL